MATITGTILDDVLATTVTADVLTGLNGNDVVLVAAAAHHAAGENLDGGAGGYDRLWFNGATLGDTLVLLAATKNFEAVQIVDEAGNAGGTEEVHLNAAAVATGLLLAGNAADNSLTGTAKDDIFIGGDGEDVIVGGLGNDRVVMDVTGGNTDFANAGAQAEGNTLILIGAAPEVAILDLTAADQLVSFDVTLDGPVQSGFSHVDASGLGGFGANITGSAGKNILIGSAQDDVFAVASSLHYISSDVVSGGFGADVVRFSSTTALQTLTLNALLTGVERAEIAAADGDASGATTLSLSAAAVKTKMVLAGNEGANTITGTAFDDSLYGNGGADSLAGGKGNDLYFYDDASDGVVGDRISDAAGTADYIAFTDTNPGAMLVLGASISGIEGAYAMGLDSTGAAFDLVEAIDRGIDGSALAATVNMKFTGNAGDNTLIGGKGKDTLTGNDGVDSILGGLGADVVVMDVDATSVDVIDAGDLAEGNTLKLVGALASGRALVDLTVAAGGDQLTFLDGAAEGSVQAGFTRVDASALETAPTTDHGVQVTGSALANALVGSAQSDIFVVLSSLEFTSADSLQGGGGNDSIRFTSTIAGQTLVVGANVSGFEEVEISDIDGDNDEMTTLSISAAASKQGLILTGNDGLNTLTGSASDDTLNGNGGVDVMIGGGGDNEYLYDSAADFAVGERITDDIGGDDSVRFASTTGGEILVLTSQVVGIEAIFLDEPVAETLSGASIGVDASALAKAVRIEGNDGANTITGTKYDDLIRGGKGADSILGGLGRDTITISVDAGDEDVAIAGAYTEGNVLRLSGEEFRIVQIDLSVASGADQTNLPGMQSGFIMVDASLMLEGYVEVMGSSRGERMIGTNYNPDATVVILADIFAPGLGNDTVEGGAGDDRIVVYSQAELNGDVYIDTGNGSADYLFFEGNAHGQTLVIADSMINGVDAAAAGEELGVFDLNINASAVNKPFGLAGNTGRNVLTSTRHGESLFDYGGADTMNGGGGDDDYVIIGDWVHGAMGVGDRINDTSGTRDDLYNATSSQVIVVNPAMITGIERFVVSGADLDLGRDYRRNIEATNDAGFDLALWGKAVHLAGSYGDNYLRGTKFGDTIIGHKGQDTIIGGLGADQIRSEVGAGDIDEIDAGLYAENNYLTLGGEASSVPTGDGLVRIDLGVAEGADQILSIDSVAESLVQSGFRHVNASFIDDYGVAASGSAAVNTIIGTSQDDILDGRGGADKLYGGDGNDAFVVSDVAEFVAGDLFVGGEEVDTEDTLRFASTVAGATLSVVRERLDEIEVVAITDFDGDDSGLTALNLSAATYDEALRMVGNFGDNSITGTAFADTLVGNLGADTLRGNAGNDVYLAFAPGEVVAGDSIVDTAGGADVFRFTSQTDGEVVVLTNLMTGLEIAELVNDVDDIPPLEFYDTGIDASALVAKITLLGNDGANALTGSAFGDSIVGGLGIDIIAGGGGADTISMAATAADMDDVDGGAIAEGNLLVLTGSTSGGMVWNLASGGDQLLSVGGGDEGRSILGITHIDASGMGGGPVTITGSAEANTLVGTDSNDVFIVLAAADFALGERYDGREFADDNDIVRFTSTTGGEVLLLTALVTGIETLQLSDAAGVLTGTGATGVNAAALPNGVRIEGNDGANTLTGSAFADSILGGGGTDSIVAGAGADVITMEMPAADADAINAGAAAEGNQLVLIGAASGAVAMDLNLAGDQLSGAEALVQSGFLHFDASAMTGFSVTVTGTAGNNSIAGTALADVINAGAGMDWVSMSVGGGTTDAINAGALAEGNVFLLTGAAAGTVVVDLTQAGDQLTSINGGADAAVQSGFTHLDASAMTGAGVEVTGTAGANSITGSDQADTISAGAGADVITWDVATASDTVDAGGSADGDTLVLIGSAAGVLRFDLAVAPGEDQLLSINAVNDAAVQSDFQHIDARNLASSGINARGNGLNNTFFGSNQSDTMAGLAGSDTFWLGGGDGVDASADRVVFEGAQDGVGGAAAAFSFDRIREFKSGQDKAAFTGAFNGGPNDLDDVTDNDAFNFASNAKADFSLTHEALFINALTSKLKTEAQLTAGNFASAVAAINKVGVVANAGDDGLILLQSGTFTGLYYYQEMDGVVNKVAAGELTLLGVFDASLTGADVALL